jgi:serine/threonine protein kinase
MTDTATGAPQLPGLTFVKDLGRGGFADVYLYEQERPRMRVAVKVLRGEGLNDDIKERFAAEANAMAELADHPYIVQVFRSDVTADGRPYMVMKYYPQRNLAVRSRAEQIPVTDVLQIGVRIASAVETAHRAGILHRDIKPANLLTSQYGEPGLTDFGIATTLGQDNPEEAEGMSIPWSPPEILFGRSQGDRLSDVYSLGATLWHLLAGRSPFEVPGGDNSTVALMRRIKEQPPTHTGRDDVPPSLERVLAQAMAKNPLDRPQSALALARSLQAVEREQRLAPTPLVILDDQVQPDSAGDDGGGATGGPTATGLSRTGPGATQDDPATRLRRPQEVNPELARDDPATRRRRPQEVNPAWAPGPSETRPRVPPAVATGPRRPRAREGMPEEVGGTIRRPVSIPAPGPAVPESPDGGPGPQPDKKPRTALLIGAAVVIVAAVVGLGVALTGSPGSSRSNTTTTQPGPPPTAVIGPSNTPVVTASRISASQVRYSWTDPSGQAGDTFVVSVSRGPYQSNGTSRTLVLAVPAGQQKCIDVEIVRDGAAGPPGTNC